MDKLKGYVVKTVVVLVNAALVAGGVFYFKNQQQKKQEAENLVANEQADQLNQAKQYFAEQAQQLQQIIEQNRNQTVGAISKNPSSVTVQKPTTVTQTIPAVTSQKTTKAS